MMKTKSKIKKCSRSLVLEILDWFGFRLRRAAYGLDLKKWQLVWKSNDCIVFFARRYSAHPFRRFESCFFTSAEKKPRKPFSICFAEFLGSVEAFEIEDRLEDSWIKNPFFGCRSLEEMAVKLDLLDVRRL